MQRQLEYYMDVKHILYNMVYVPTMHRWGDLDGHQYVMGIYTDLNKAVKACEEERERRGGKYEWAVYAYALDRDRFESKEETKTRTVAKSEEMSIHLDEDLDKVIKDSAALKLWWADHWKKKNKEKAESLEEEIKNHEEALKWLNKQKEERERIKV